VKTAADVYTPVECDVVEINQAAKEKPEIVNEDAENNGWLMKIKVKDSKKIGK
jgi:glycine cleavage system H protein